MSITVEAIGRILREHDLRGIGEWTDGGDGTHFCVTKEVEITTPHLETAIGIQEEYDYVFLTKIREWQRRRMVFTPEWARVVERIAREHGISYQDSYLFMTTVGEDKELVPAIGKLVGAEERFSTLVDRVVSYRYWAK